MIDLCQWFGKVMKKIYTYQIFLRFFEMASVIRALITKKKQASIWP
jgi:hypothetical protein